MDSEAESSLYITQMWAKAMTIYRRGGFKLKLSLEMEKYLKAHQKEFMPEDTEAGQIIGFLERFTGKQVCSKQLYREALGDDYSVPKKWELQQINDIMNYSGPDWLPFENPRSFGQYGRQRGWEPIAIAKNRQGDSTVGNDSDKNDDGFQSIEDEGYLQEELPF